MRKATVLTLLALAVMLTSLTLASAAVSPTSQQISLSGRLMGSDGRAISGTANMTFQIYNSASGGSLLYTETHPSVAVTGGLWNVQLGSITPLNLLFNGPYYLQATVNGEAAGTRVPLTAAPYCRALGNFVFNNTSGNAMSLSNLIMAADDGIFAVGGSSASDDPANINNYFSVNLADSWLRSRLANNYFDGKVGIGTVNPMALLHVAGAILSTHYAGGLGNASININSSNPKMDFIEADAPSGMGARIGSSTGNSYGDFAIIVTNENFGVANGAGRTIEAVTVKNASLGNGNVGINAINPARKLHINDTLRIEPRSDAPNSPALGDLYVDSDGYVLCFYNSTDWLNISGPGTCSIFEA